MTSARPRWGAAASCGPRRLAKGTAFREAHGAVPRGAAVRGCPLA